MNETDAKLNQATPAEDAAVPTAAAGHATEAAAAGKPRDARVPHPPRAKKKTTAPAGAAAAEPPDAEGPGGGAVAPGGAPAEAPAQASAQVPAQASAQAPAADAQAQPPTAGGERAAAPAQVPAIDAQAQPPVAARAPAAAPAPASAQAPAADAQARHPTMQGAPAEVPAQAPAADAQAQHPAAGEERAAAPAGTGAVDRGAGQPDVAAGDDNRRRERRGRGLRAHIGRGKRGADERRDGREPRGGGGHDARARFDDVVSGRYDAQADDAGAPPARRVLAPDPESPKLHKVLAQAGLGSRLEMEQLILEGRISVNGEPSHIGQRIQFGDQVRVNGKPIRVRIAPPAARVLAYHKPSGEMVTHDDPQHRPTVFAHLPRLAHGKWQSVGRLDLNTEGLLLVTNSGELANALMHPRFGVEREYAVRVLGGLSAAEKQRLLEGVDLEDGRAQFRSIEDGGGDGANQWYRMVLVEGRNREVRRMLEALGHAVSRLIRIRYGVVTLPAGLHRGQWLELPESDVTALARLSGARMPKADASGGNGPGKHQQGRGGNRHGDKRDEVPRNQPDPMKTSVGYIVHETFTPTGLPGGWRNRGAGGGKFGGAPGFGGRNDFNRGRGNRKRNGGGRGR